MARLTKDFYCRPCLEVSRNLVGKVLVHATQDGVIRLRISETECYCGEEDTACHAHKGKTARTKVMYETGGTSYIYLCYGVHWLLNVVTGEEGHPEAALIRACVDANGPGKLTKKLQITGALNDRDLTVDPEIWIEDDGFCCKITADKRVGIDYAQPEDRDRLWRFIMVSE